MILDKRPQSHLINIIKSTRDHHPNFVLMLGAGASASSNVKLARDMIKEWRTEHYKMYKNDSENLEEHLKRFPNLFNIPEEYSILFEKLYDEPSQRREYIESCINSANPSWGYIYLVNLLKCRVFNTVFTTNFDDLLNEACYQFSNEVRPIVCAHDSSITSVRITSSRPKIIKLHGDFLFDNIKNTTRELESLEKNTMDKFKQYASEFGFIVVGYAGNDRSVMDTFNTLLKFDNYFPHGVYWCIRKGSEPSQKVDLLCRFPKFKLIEIDGFDDFFADIHNELQLPLQPEMADPYNALASRLNKLVGSINLQQDKIHPVIDRDIKNLGYHISKISEVSKANYTEGAQIVKENLPIPYGFLSSVNEMENDLEMAFKYRVKEIETEPSYQAFTELFKLMFKSNNVEHKDALLEKFYNSKEIYSKRPMATFDVALQFIDNGDFDNAHKILSFGNDLAKRFNGEFYQPYYFLNKLQIKAHKKEEFDEKEKKVLTKILESTDTATKFGASILLKDYKSAEEYLRILSEKGDISYISTWPIVKLLIPHMTDEQLKERLFKRQK